MQPVLLFDLDGTPVHCVNQHVIAWKQTLDAEGIDVTVWRLHSRMGMSGGLFAKQIPRETAIALSAGRTHRLLEDHEATDRRSTDRIRPLSGAHELLSPLAGAHVPSVVAISGRIEPAAADVAALGVDSACAAAARRDQVRRADLDPGPFPATTQRLGAPIESTLVIGDSTGDMLAALLCQALGAGLLSGRYGLDELHAAAAIRVYEDSALFTHSGEVGGGIERHRCGER